MNNFEHIPFIKMLYTHKGERKIYDSDSPIDIIKHFENENPDDYCIDFFFVMGQMYGKVKTLQDVMQFCKN